MGVTALVRECRSLIINYRIKRCVCEYIHTSHGVGMGRAGDQRHELANDLPLLELKFHRLQTDLFQLQTDINGYNRAQSLNTLPWQIISTGRYGHTSSFKANANHNSFSSFKRRFPLNSVHRIQTLKGNMHVLYIRHQQRSYDRVVVNSGILVTSFSFPQDYCSNDANLFVLLSWLSSSSPSEL